MTKYELTSNTKVVDGVTVYQIKATKDFANVKTGDLGGWIQYESNLSQDGNCWVYENAFVSGNARVFDDAWVSGNAHVSGNARVFGSAIVSGSDKIK